MSTFWIHTVPWCDSIQHAFNSLRWEVFQAREYRGDRDAPSIYALRRACGAQGTHSVLDMQWVAPEPRRGTVAPLSPDVLKATFGTMCPTRKQFEAAELPQRPAWEGTYVVLYEDNRPREIVFYGRSGSDAAANTDVPRAAPRARRTSRRSTPRQTSIWEKKAS